MTNEQDALRRCLAQVIPKAEFSGIPFQDVVQFLRDVSGCNIYVNWSHLAGAFVDQRTPVNVSLGNVTLGKLLEYVLRDVGGIAPLAAVLDEGLIRITTTEDAHAGYADPMILEAAPERDIGDLPRPEDPETSAPQLPSKVVNGSHERHAGARTDGLHVPVPHDSCGTGRPDPRRAAETVDQRQPSEEEDPFPGWEGFKRQIDNDPDTYLEDGVTLRPVRREADGEELGRSIESLVTQVRQLWSASGPLMIRIELREWEEDEVDECLEALHPCRLRLWATFSTAREAEKWLHRELGPDEAVRLLDGIGDGLSGMEFVLSQMPDHLFSLKDVGHSAQGDGHRQEGSAARLRRWTSAEMDERRKGTRESYEELDRELHEALGGLQRVSRLLLGYAMGGRGNQASVATGEAGSKRKSAVPTSDADSECGSRGAYLSWGDLLAEFAREERKGNLDPGRVGATGYREVEGGELASVLDALMVEAEDAWGNYAQLWRLPEPLPLSEQDNDRMVPEADLDALARLDGSCWRAVRCALEAEHWLRKEAGPLAAAELLDEIAVGIQLAMRVVAEINEVIEVRSPEYVRRLREGSLKQYDEDMRPLLPEEVIAEHISSCAEFDRAFVGQMEKFHGVIRRLKEVAATTSSGPKKRSKGAEKMRRRPGRPRVSAKGAEHRSEILAAWKKARHAAVSRQDFCHDWGEMHPDEEPLTVKDLETFADWARQREIREDETK